MKKNTRKTMGKKEKILSMLIIVFINFILLSPVKVCAIDTFDPVVLGLSRPQGIAIDSHGNILVSESGRGRNGDGDIKKYDVNGNQIGNAPIISGLSQPYGIAIDSDGNIFVTESGSQDIKKYSADGTLIDTIVPVISNPQGIAIDSNGDILVVSNYNFVKKYSANGTFIADVFSPYGVPNSTRLAAPAGIAIDSNGNIFVANTAGGNVKEYTSNGVFIKTILGFSNPEGIAIDSNGDILVADIGNGYIWRCDSNGTIISSVSGFRGPFGIAIDSNRDVFVTDAFTGNIDKIVSKRTSVTNVEQIQDINVKKGTDISNAKLPQTVSITLSDLVTTSVAVTWDDGTPTYDGNVAGTYRFTGRLTLTDGITNPDDLKAHANVIVESGQVTTPAAVTYDLNYTAGNGGTITGDLSQTIKSGEDGSEVVAVPNSNYYFVGWSDGKTNARRKDVNVMSDINVSAIFKANPSTNSSSSSSSRHSSSTDQITVKVTDGKSDNTISQTVIERTTSGDGTKKDNVTYTADKAKETLAALASEGKDTARIVAEDSDTSVSETKVDIPSDTLTELSSGNVNLEIQTNGAIVSVPKESVQSLVGSGQLNGDLYFRVVPIKDQAKQAEIKTTADQQATIRAVSGNNGVQVLGTPMTIETNMSQRSVDIVLPLTGLSLPTDEAERQAFLNDLGVFIEHSDGEKVLQKGQVVEYAKGVFGLKFTVNKFSDFTIVKLNKNNQTGWKQENGYWYFLNNDGTKAKGWHKADAGEWTYQGKDTKDTWFHLDADYKMNTGWFKDTDGSWYFLCDGKDVGALGAMETGWKFIDGKWYFLKDNGVMATGWTNVDGNWYYLYSDGSMASSTVIDGYTLGADGAWSN